MTWTTNSVTLSSSWNRRRRTRAATSDMFFVPKVIRSGIFGWMLSSNGLIIVILKILNLHHPGVDLFRIAKHKVQPQAQSVPLQAKFENPLGSHTIIRQIRIHWLASGTIPLKQEMPPKFQDPLDPRLQVACLTNITAMDLRAFPHLRARSFRDPRIHSLYPTWAPGETNRTMARRLMKRNRGSEVSLVLDPRLGLHQRVKIPCLVVARSVRMQPHHRTLTKVLCDKPLVHRWRKLFDFVLLQMSMYR